MERCGDVSPRVSPPADIRDLGGLLDEAGFSLLTIDTADVVIDYSDKTMLIDGRLVGRNQITNPSR
jgi:NADH dehydrogenase [ubiquinone] 1 alpha subcomplex assembly factor 5